MDAVSQDVSSRPAGVREAGSSMAWFAMAAAVALDHIVVVTDSARRQPY
jgi:hypothetical protein